MQYNEPIFRVGDYLTDNDRYLYYVKHIHTNGMYDLENCRTGFSITVDDHFIKYLDRVNHKREKELVRTVIE